MGLTPAERKRLQRQRDKLRAAGASPEEVAAFSGPAVQAAKVSKAERETACMQLIEEVAAQDAAGTRYKSEARSLTQLVRIYYGQPEHSDVETDEEKKRDKGPKRPNPSMSRIRIQNTQVDPVEKKGGRRRRSLADITFETDDVVGFWRWLDLRDRARKDLFWLGRVLGKGLYRSVHQITCDQFVPKNFGGEWLNSDGTADQSREAVEPMYFQGYTLDDVHDMIDEHHEYRELEMLLLDARGFYKSTIDGIDCVQWILNCPDIRILIITGEYKLSAAFLKEIKDYFFLTEGAEPSAFHLLFPEYVLHTTRGETLQSPARIIEQKEDTLWVNSIVANLSGWHCDIKKGDDVVTDENSNTVEAREKLKTKYDGTDDLLDPHGFMDHIGTRYFTDDWYGTRLSTVDPDTGKPEPIKYHMRGCWVVKPEYREVPLLQLTEEMVTLNFPQRHTFKKLRSKLVKKGERQFKNQQLNEPSDAEVDSGFKISFTEADIRSHSYLREAAPKHGETFILWDWALSEKKTSDYSAGVAVRIYRDDAGEYCASILEVLFDKWKYSELAYQIIAFSKRWNPKTTMIEASNAYDMLRDEVVRVGNRVGYQPHIYWRPASNEDNAKRNRIKSLEILISENRLHFVLGPWMDELIKQFTQYTGEKKNKGRKDDIPDAASFLTYLLPASARPHIEGTDPEEERRIAEDQYRQVQRAKQYEDMFGTRLIGTRNQPGAPNKPAPTWREYLTGKAPEPKPVEPVIEKPLDPRMAIFGNKGPWRL